MRPDQARFKIEVFRRYGPRCPLSGIAVPEMVEAAHLRGDADGGSSDARNGLPMNAALHRAFDAHLFAINPDTLTVEVRPEGPTLDQLGVIHPKLALSRLFAETPWCGATPSGCGVSVVRPEIGSLKVPRRNETRTPEGRPNTLSNCPRDRSGAFAEVHAAGQTGCAHGGERWRPSVHWTKTRTTNGSKPPLSSEARERRPAANERTEP